MHNDRYRLYIFGMQILCFQTLFSNLAEIYNSHFFHKYFITSTKVGPLVLPCVAGNTVPLDGINSLGMLWLSLSTSQCPAYTYVQARTQLFIKGFTLFLPYRDKEVNYTV